MIRIDKIAPNVTHKPWNLCQMIEDNVNIDVNFPEFSIQHSKPILLHHDDVVLFFFESEQFFLLRTFIFQVHPHHDPSMNIHKGLQQSQKSTKHVNYHIILFKYLKKMSASSSSTNKTFDSLTSGKTVLERARYIPIRLTLEERKKLRLLEAALNVSEYTDKIDTIQRMGKLQRIKDQCDEICAILCGLMVAADYKVGKQLIENRNFKDNEEFFQDM